jgi:nucleotide-binding universal stress UspA family protein
MRAEPSTRHPDTARLRRRILVCLDRSTFSEVCVPHAVALAKTFGSAITLTHVMQPHHDQGGSPSDAVGWEIARQEARRYLERIEGFVIQAVDQPVEVRLEQGRPSERIVDLAREVAADICVLGSQGEGRAPAGTLGSTVQRVLTLARSSVLIAHSSATVPTAVTPKRLLVPLDGSRRTESVLPTAARIASAHRAELLLVHVVQEPLPTALLAAAEDMALARTLAGRLESGATQYLGRLQRQLEHEGTSVRTLVVRDANEHRCLLAVSRREQSDLIVLAAHGSSCDSARSFGSVTAYFLTHSTVPLLVLQDIPEREQQGAQDVERQTPPSLRASYAPESV